MEEFFSRERGADDIGVRDRGPVTRVSEEIAAEQCPGRLLEKDTRLPVVWHMRSVDVPDTLSAEVDDLAVRQLARRPVAEVVERDHAAERTMRNLGAGRRRQELVHGPAFVGLHVPECDPPEPLERNDASGTD